MDRFEGVASLDRQDAEEVEANVLGSVRGKLEQVIQLMEMKAS